MSKIENYREQLRQLDDWLPFLLTESNLPGPRANLELAHAAADVGDETRFRQLIAAEPSPSAPNSPREFFTVCGLIGLGQVLATGQRAVLPMLRHYASDSRWRAREAVCMGLQRWGDVNMNGLLAEMETWAMGNLLEKRAVAAALCEPRLLKQPEHARQVLNLLDQITTSMLTITEQRAEDFKTLRKGLAYCWSVAVVALPEAGKPLLEHWLNCDDKDIRWLVKENLKKDRLSRMDAAWVEQMQMRLT